MKIEIKSRNQSLKRLFRHKKKKPKGMCVCPRRGLCTISWYSQTFHDGCKANPEVVE